MKTKKFKQKLGLKKSTVANLNPAELKRVKGGDTLFCNVTEGGALCEWSAQCPETWTGGSWLPCVSAGDDCSLGC